MVISVIGKHCFATQTDRLEGKKYYLGLPGTRLTLTWTYHSTKMFQSLFITIPGSANEDEKLWDVKYDSTTNQITINKLDIADSVFNNITEFSIEKNTIFKLVIKSIPKGLTSFHIGCFLRQSKFDTLEKKALVDVAGEHFIHIMSILQN